MKFFWKTNLIVLIFILGIVIAGCSTNNGKSDDLYLGIMNGNLEQVKEAIADGADINEIEVANSTETSPTMFAIKEGQDIIANYLIESGADVNYADHSGYSLLMYSAYKAKTNLCEVLLKHGAKPNQTDKQGHSALEYALQGTAIQSDERQIDRIITMLLDHGVKVRPVTFETAMEEFNNSKSMCSYNTVQEILKGLIRSGYSSNLEPIMEAAILGESSKTDGLIKANQMKKDQEKQILFFTAAFGHAQTLKLFEEKGVDLRFYNNSDLNYNDKLRHTLFTTAAKFGNLDVVKYLLAEDSTLNAGRYTPLATAVDYNQYEIAEYLIKNGAKITNDVFYYAAANGNVKMMDLLINNGFLPDQEGKGSALMIAVEKEQMEATRYLLELGADANWDNDITTPLSIACATGNTEIIKLLIEHGAKINGKNNDGNPLYSAVKSGDKVMVEYLVNSGADINIENPNKNIDTILRTAVFYGYFDIVKLLVEKGADLEYRNPIMEAASRGSKNILEYLIQQGAEVNVQSENGFTALMLAAKNDYTNNVKVLLKYNADAQLKNKEGQTALDIAKEKNHKEIIAILEDAQ